MSGLQALALVYGLTRVERSLAFFLAAGVLCAKKAAALRLAVNSLCAQLSANQGKTLVRLCDSFGIPDHLMSAPIAHDWQLVGTGINGY